MASLNFPRLIRCALLLATPIVPLGLSACLDNAVSGTSTPMEFCLDKATLDCHVYFDCWDQTRRDTLTVPGAKTWTGKADCETKQKALCTATPAGVCGPDLVFQEMRSNDCIKAWNTLSCSDWVQPEPPKPPACYQCDPVTKDSCVISYCTKPTSI